MKQTLFVTGKGLDSQHKRDAYWQRANGEILREDVNLGDECVYGDSLFTRGVAIYRIHVAGAMG